MSKMSDYTWLANPTYGIPVFRGEVVSSERPGSALAELYEMALRSNKVSAFWFREVAIALGKRQPALMAEPTASSCRNLAVALRDNPEALVGITAVFETFELWCRSTGETPIESLSTPADWHLYAKYVEGRHVLAFAVYTAPVGMPADHPLAPGKAYSFGTRLAGRLDNLDVLIAALDEHAGGRYMWVT
jgi:hypothetical protein